MRGNYLQISLDVSLRQIVCVHLVPNGLRPGAWIVPRSLDNIVISSPKIQQGTISNDNSQSNEVKKCIVEFSSFYFIFSIFFAAGGGNIFFGSGISWKLELPVRFPMEKSLTHSN